MIGSWWYTKPFEDGKNHIRRSHRKQIQITVKSIHNGVNKSEDHKDAVKPDLHTDERFLHVFLTKKRKRSLRHTRRRENIMDLPIFKAMPCESERRRENIMDLTIFKAMPYESENVLQITECFPSQDVPIHKIESFTSLHVDVQQVDNSVDALESLQLQEVPVVESLSLVPAHQASPLSKKELNDLYVREMLEYVRRKMENLDINGESKELVVRNRDFGGTLVKPDPPKKRKVLPKVNLDEESLRMWKVLMENDGSEPVEEMDEEREEWWERQRKVFRGRVDSFIAKMHLIQGNRRFSPWKGSVVDSVVGVYLTQNVSDHLSSSAFMNLAARFPVKSSTKEVCDHGEAETSQELISSNTKDMRTSCADVIDLTPIAKPEQEGDFSNPFLVQEKTCVNENSNSFRKLLDIEEVDYLKQFYSSVNDESPLNQSRDNGDLSVSEEGEKQSATSFDLSISHEPCATVSDVNVGLCEISVSRNEREVIGVKNGGDEDLNHSESEFTGKEGGFSDPILVQDKPCVDGNSNAFRTLLEEVDYLKQLCSCGNDKSPLNESRDNGDLNVSKEGDEKSATSIDLSISHEPCATISDVNVGFCEISVFENSEREVVGVKNGGDEDLNHSESKFTGKEGFFSDPVLVQDKSCVDGNSNAFRTLLDIEEVDYLKQFCTFSDNGDLNASKEGEEKSGTSFDLSISHEPCSTSTISDVNVSLCEISVFGNTEREVIVEKNEGNGHLNQQTTTLEEEQIVVAPICMLNTEAAIEERVDVENRHSSMKAIPLDPQSIGKKKSRTEEKQEVKTDWESLRRAYCKTERNENNMDAVDWDAVRRATVDEIAETIVERGMSNVLAARIKEFLERMVKDHGTIDLEWLRDVPPDKAKEFLLSIQGIGLKSVECVRLLTLHHLAFPVDTNVGRVATRLGWVPLQPLPEEVQIHLLNAYPMMDSIQKYLFPRLCTLDQRTLYELHYQLITFGKVFCTKRSPNCNACPMRAECRHYASAFASARLALPGPAANESNITSIIPAANEQNHSTPNPPPPPSLDLQLDNLGSSYHARYSEPIIEVPPSPEPEDTVPIIRDIEDYFCESDDEIPTIRLNAEEFREALQDTINVNSIALPEAEMSKAIVALTTEAASVPPPRMKYVAKLRTVHYVYELPDYHPSLSGFDEREHDDQTPYLLAIWLPGETSNSLGYNNDQEETVKGTILIPCRTANRGKFPLNGTYFQVNEVFADDETSRIPMDVPRRQLWNLPRRYLGCGTSATSIFKALSTSDIQRCFWKGSICVRGFNRKTRQPRPLHRRFHISTTAIAAENKRTGKR